MDEIIVTIKGWRPIFLLGIYVGFLFCINLIGVIEDIKYLIMGKEKYFNDIIEAFIHPRYTLLLHVIIICMVLYLVYYIFKY